MRMARTKEELKAAALKAIDDNRDKIMAIGDSIFSEPELGYKEFKTAAKVQAMFDELGIAHKDEVAITGVIAPLEGRQHKMRLSIMGELDAVVSPKHPNANPATGAAHCCGHNCMIAGLAGVAYALKEADLMKELDGDIVLMAVPAEEYVEIGYRSELKKQGKIHFLGGKQEFIRLGVFDDIDMMIMQHTMAEEKGITGVCGARGNGFIGQNIHYIGKEAHAGGAPHEGINALNAAMVGLTAVNAQRETFKDDDHIRVHPIITKGGDLVNIIPADVQLENYVRGNNVDAILDATKKVTRAFEAGGYAVGAETVVENIPGYLPEFPCDGLMDVMYENLKALMGDEHVVRRGPDGFGSSDAGDVGHLIPTMQANIAGAQGGFHTENYRLVDREMAYINSAKALVMTAIDLLADGAEAGLNIQKAFVPKMTKEQYLKDWGNL